MSKRRATRDHRCPRCQINRALCFCEYITEVTNTTPVLVVMHWREKWLTSNSTNLAQQSLTEIETVYRGKRGKEVHLNSIDQSRFCPIYLFPSEDATILTRENIEALPLPPALVVPDGTWSQAVKFHRREAALKNIPHFKLPCLGKSKYQLRKAHFDGGLSTLEAIARALGIIESDLIQKKLERMLEVMVERVKETRSGTVK